MAALCDRCRLCRRLHGYSYASIAEGCKDRTTLPFSRVGAAQRCHSRVGAAPVGEPAAYARTMSSLAQLSAVETAAVRGRTRSAEEVVAAALERAEASQAAYNCFVAIRGDHALAEARALDAGAPGHDGPLAGVPAVVKTEFDVAGLVTTLGGRGNTTPARADSEMVRRLRAAGAIVIGTTTMPEFGQFAFTESAAFGVTRNPWDISRSPGGSSGGTAVAIATGVAPIGLGADGGGSIRIPAACTGLVGLKVTRGRVSPAPLTEHWFGLVALGGLTRTALDHAVLLDAIAGSLPADRWRLPDPAEPFAATAAADPGPRRIVWTTRPATPGVRTDPQVAAVTETMARRLAGLGHRVRRTGARWPVFTDAFMPQFYAGMRIEGAQVEHPERLEPRTRQTIRLSGWARGPVVTGALRRAERVAAALDRRFLTDADVIVLPTMPLLPAPVGLLDGLATVRAQIATVPYVANTAITNVTGHPSISVHAGLSREGWPIGVQLIARRGGEGLLLALARQLEQTRPEPIAYPTSTAS